MDMTTTERFALYVQKDSNDVWGWNGYVLDRASNKRHGLLKVVLDYEVDGERGYSHCAFDTRAELVAAAKRKVRTLARAA
jgi:hypothetical protein